MKKYSLVVSYLALRLLFIIFSGRCDMIKIKLLIIKHFITVLILIRFSNSYSQHGYQIVVESIPTLLEIILA